MSGKIFSIDIRSNGIAGLLIKNTLKGNWIETFRFVPFEEIHDNTGGSDSRLSDAVKKVIEDIDLTGCDYVVSLSPDFISYRNLRVPFKDRKKISQILPFELEATLPYPIDEVTLDFQSIRQSEQTEILVSVVKTSKLTAVLDALKENNIDPRLLTSGGLSAAICLSRFSEAYKDFIYVEMDGWYCSIFAVDSGSVHIVRSLVVKTTDPVVKARKIADGLSQTLAAFDSYFINDFNPSIIFYSGDEGLDGNFFQKAFEHILDVPVQQIDIFNEVNLKLKLSGDLNFKKSLMNNALSLAVIEILGINSINLYGDRSILKKYWEEYKNEIIKTGLIASFVFVLAMFNVLFEAHFLQKEVNRLNHQIVGIFQKTLPDVSKIVDPLQQMRARIQQDQNKNRFAGEMGEEALNIDIINEMSSLIPETLDVEFTRFVRGDNNLLISGDTDTFNSVDDIKIKLGRATTVKNITISSANLEKTSNRIQFKLKIDL